MKAQGRVRTRQVAHEGLPRRREIGWPRRDDRDGRGLARSASHSTRPAGDSTSADRRAAHDTRCARGLALEPQRGRSTGCRALGGCARRDKPIAAGRTKLPGIKIHDTRMLRLMEVLLHGGSQLAGWRTVHLYTAVVEAFGIPPTAYSLMVRWSRESARAARHCCCSRHRFWKGCTMNIA
jgi:hypothetical protein